MLESILKSKLAKYQNHFPNGITVSRQQIVTDAFLMLDYQFMICIKTLNVKGVTKNAEEKYFDVQTF